MKKPAARSQEVSSGVPALDAILQGLRPGDNVVWQIDAPESYREFTLPLAAWAAAAGRPCVYVRFAEHPPLVRPGAGVTQVAIDPRPGFDFFCGEVYQLVKRTGPGAVYVFDNLSKLVESWATDEQLANFFQVVCPYLFELRTVAYFAVSRGQHSHSCISRIRDTTQVLLDLFHADDHACFVHPVKVLGRYTPTMFWPHQVVAGGPWIPVFRSGDAARLSTAARRPPFGSASDGAAAPWEAVYRKLQGLKNKHPEIYCLTPEDELLKRDLIGMLFGADRDFKRLADSKFTVGDLLGIRERVLGSGRIGGKAAGMLLARAVLRETLGVSRVNAILEPHDSFYIGSDAFFTFLVTNGLFRLRLEPGDAESFPEIERRFLEGRFPDETLQQFRVLLDYYGQAPIAVRSSSLLEDGFAHDFTGTYRTEFCVNQGTPEARLDEFLRAVKLVYASLMHPDAVAYRRRRGVQERDEQMAVLIQRVAGMPHGNLFFPIVSGVAYSPGVPQLGGTARLLFGLGTRAADRASRDQARMASLHPGAAAAAAAAAPTPQQLVDVLDLNANRPKTLPFREVAEVTHRLKLALCASRQEGAALVEPEGGEWQWAVDAGTVPTFNNLLRRTEFVGLLRQFLETLEKIYGAAVDMEFTVAVAAGGQIRINLLQCKPLRLSAPTGGLPPPPAGLVANAAIRPIRS
ncbi:MAG: PEP/pyruvate-binding domain-containing protein [Lentisphaeria bacterium]|jgi:hypothetical protein